MPTNIHNAGMNRLAKRCVMKFPSTLADGRLSPEPFANRNFAVTPTVAIETDADLDLDLSRRVRSFLFEAHMPGLRNVDVEAQNGIVTLSGQVKTYYEKQLGGQRARRVAGVVRLVDRIRVAH